MGAVYFAHLVFCHQGDNVEKHFREPSQIFVRIVLTTKTPLKPPASGYAAALPRYHLPSPSASP